MVLDRQRRRGVAERRVRRVGQPHRERLVGLDDPVTANGDVHDALDVARSERQPTAAGTQYAEIHLVNRLAYPASLDVVEPLLAERDEGRTSIDELRQVVGVLGGGGEPDQHLAAILVVLPQTGLRAAESQRRPRQQGVEWAM